MNFSRGGGRVCMSLYIPMYKYICRVHMCIRVAAMDM